MTKVDLIAKVAAEAELTKKDAEKAVAAVLDGITEALKAGDKVALVGFGTFETRERPARKGQMCIRDRLHAGRDAAFLRGPRCHWDDCGHYAA